MQASGSPIEFGLKMYTDWSVRFSFQVLNGVFFHSPDLFPIYALVTVAAFMYLPWVLLTSLDRFSHDSVNKQAPWLLAAAALAGLYLALLPFLAKAVFWLTGRLEYVVPLTLGLLFVRYSAARAMS